MNKEWSTTATSLYHIKEQLKTLKAQESQIANRLRDLSGNTTAHNESFVYKKEMRKGLPDYEKMINIFKIDRELFRKPDGEFWTIIKL